MAAPKQADLIFYTNRPLIDTDWSTNWLKVIAWLTDGAADITAGSITVDDLTVGNNIAATGTITAGGAITGDTLVGDGSGITGLNYQNKNFLVNGGATVDQTAADYTLIKDTYGVRADKWYGMATGTLVSAGTLTALTSAAHCGRTGYAFKFSGVTLTGSGSLTLRYQMPSVDAAKLSGQAVSLSFRTYHDIGSSKNYVIYYEYPDVKDNFTAVTAITNSGNKAVANATETLVEYENVSIGTNVDKGLQIRIVVTAGAITTKLVEFVELQLEIGATATSYAHMPYTYELNLCGGVASLIKANAFIADIITKTEINADVAGTGLAQHTDGSLKVANTMGSFAQVDVDTKYLAATDGFVAVIHLGDGASAAGAKILIGSSTDIDAGIYQTCASEAQNGDQYGGFTCPVNKGQYWKVAQIGAPDSITVRWMPMGC